MSTPIAARLFPRDALMLGCAPLGGLYHRRVTAAEVDAVVRAAVLRHGIRDIDTAPWYGHGKSELDLGAALTALAAEAGAGAPRVRVHTKVGRVLRRRAECDPSDTRVAWGDTCYAIVAENADVVPVHDYTRAGVLESVAGSLRRLRLGPPSPDAARFAVLASLRLHDCEGDPRRVAEATEGGGAEELLAQCAALGAQASLGMNDPAAILRLLRWSETAPAMAAANAAAAPRRHAFASVLMAGCWNLMDQSGLAVLEYCEAAGVAVHNAGVFGAGLLWGAAKYRYADAGGATLRRRDEWADLCARLGVSLPAAAFAFAALPAPVTAIAFGVASEGELDASVACADASVGVDIGRLVELARERGLLSERVAEKAREWALARRRSKL
jgi:D-threo-aldose 1-dehydrogenase